MLRFVQSNFFIFLVVFLNLVVAFYSFLWITNFSKNIYSDFISYVESDKSYTIYSALNLSKLNDFIASNKQVLRRVYASLEKGSEEQSVIAQLYGSGRTDIQTQYGRYFTESELQNGEKVILLPLSLSTIENSQNYSVGSTYILNTDPYTIIGISSEDCYLVPFNSLDESDYIQSLTIVTNDYLDVDAFIAGICDNLDVQFVEGPSPKPSFFEIDFGTEFILMFLIIALGVINLCSLYSAILKKRNPMSRVYTVCGASGRQLFAIYLEEFLFTSILAYLVSIMFFLITTDAFNKRTYLFTRSLTVTNYSAIYLFVCALIILCLLIQNRSLFNHRK